MSVITRGIKLVVVGLGCLILVVPGLVRAMSFEPTVTDLQIEPGISSTVKFTITNDSLETKNYLTDLRLVNFAEQTNEVIFVAWPASLASFIKSDTTGFSLAAGQRQDVVIDLNPPADYPAAALTIALVVREDISSVATQVATGMSGLIFLTIGEPVAVVDLQSLTVPAWLLAALPVNFQISLQNSGTRTLQPVGTITVYNVLSQRVATLDINPQQSRIPSSQARSYNIAWGEARVQGNFWQELWREVTNPQVGLFTAELLAAPYADGEATIQATTRFVMWPWRASLSFIGLVVVAVFVRRSRR